jgi:hypothetical protein
MMKRGMHLRVVNVWCLAIGETVELSIGGVVQGTLICGKVVDCSRENCKKTRHLNCRIGKQIMVKLDE